MPNFEVGPISGAKPASVSVGVTSVQVVAASDGALQTRRVGLIVTNLSTGTIYLSFSGLAAALNAGVPIGANGGVFSMDEYSYNQDQINGIAHVAASQVAVQEFYN